MKYIVKKILIFIISVFVISSIFIPRAEARKIRIGILQWAIEPRYEEGKRAIREQLSDEGFDQPETEFLIENANGNVPEAMKLAKKLAAEKMDLYIAIGSSAAVPLCNEVKNTPVIFCAVYDPVEAKIALGWQSSGNNTTGSSTMVPMSKIVEVLKKAAPVKKIIVLYTPGEFNTEIQLQNLQSLEDKFDIKVIPLAITNKEEVPAVLSSLADKADAMYISGGGIVGTCLPQIVEIATKANLITFTHLADSVIKGCLMGVCANSKDVGYAAGKRAVMVLKGAKPSEIPIGIVEEPDVMLNIKTLKSGKFNLSADFLKTVTRRIEL